MAVAAAMVLERVKSRWANQCVLAMSGIVVVALTGAMVQVVPVRSAAATRRLWVVIASLVVTAACIFSI